MISIESEVLQRHLPFLKQKAILFAGGIQDQFPQFLQQHSEHIEIWSWYFDYIQQLAHSPLAVHFDLYHQPKADLILYYWTKNKQEVNFQLMQLLSQAKLGQEMLIIGENRCGVRSAEKLLAAYGEIAKIDSARRCGLYHFRLTKQPHFQFESYWKTYQPTQLPDLAVHSLPGVFSANELDGGTALLLSTLNSNIKGKLLDLGCGAGVIGTMLKKLNPQSEITLADIYAPALSSAKRTLAANQLQGEVIASDVFSHIQGKFDVIMSNPPFHDGIDTAYRAVRELIAQAKQHLTKEGELRIVANAFLPYPDLLAQHFGTFEVLAQNNKFKVYSVRNR